MGKTDFEQIVNKRGGWRRQFVRIGARIVKSLLFCGGMAILASSIYGSIQKIGARDTYAGEKSGAEDTFAGEKSGAEDTPASEASSGTQEKVLISETDKRVALTFDDGPHRIYTKELLDGLAKRNVHATFFVIGKNIPGNEDLIARMKQEGHLIGNHTYDHVKICDLSGEEACEQLEKTSALVREITGENTEFVRPPFGEWNKEMECSFTMIPVLWDVDPLDWTTKNTALVEQRVLKSVESGDIILMHDFYESSVEAALDITDALLAQGYEFVTVDELILE